MSDKSSGNDNASGTDYLAREFFAGGGADVSLNNTFNLLNSTAGSVFPPMEGDNSFASLDSEIAYTARVAGKL